MSNFKLESIETVTSGLDAFFEREPAVITPPGQVVTPKTASTGRMKVGSLAALDGFTRASSDTLIQKSTNDLWALRQDGESYYIERLFADSGTPLKG